MFVIFTFGSYPIHILNTGNQLLGSHLIRILSADVHATHLLEEKLLKVYSKILLKGGKKQTYIKCWKNKQ